MLTLILFRRSPLRVVERLTAHVVVVKQVFDGDCGSRRTCNILDF